MNKIINILLLMAVFFMMLSCIETNGLDEVPEGEICMSPILSDMIRTRDGNGTTPYPDGSSFGVFAYYSDTEAGSGWTTSPETYFENCEFGKKGESYSGVDPVYWPLSGSLVFAGYSPYDEDTDVVEFDTRNKTLSINNYEVNGTTDLMYFLPVLSDGNYTGYGKSTMSVPIEFHHALSSVNINVAVKAGDEAKIRLKSITLKSIYTHGTFSVNAANASSGTWETTGDPIEKILHSDDSGTSLSAALDYVYYTIPGDACEIEIVYFDNEVQKSHTILPANHIENWDIGSRYQYNITLSRGLEPVIIDKYNTSASIEHIYQSGTTLAGSQLRLNLGLTSAQLARIKNLTVSVKKGSVTYKEKTFATVSSNTLTITEGSKLYLPYSSGNFDVICTYNDGLEDRSLTLTASAPKPEFNVTIDCLATSSSVTINSARVNISQSVLNEIPLSGNGGYMISFLGKTYYDFTTSDSSLSNPTFISSKTKSALPKDAGTYQVMPYLKFDGAEITSATLITNNKYTTSDNRIYTISVDVKKYKRSTQIYDTRNIQSGKMYVICTHWNTSSYWYVDDSYQQLKLSNSAPDMNDITPEYIFYFEGVSADQISVASNYKCKSEVGVWKSFDGKYLNTTFPYAFSSTIAMETHYLICASGWDNSSGSQDIDMCHDYSALFGYSSNAQFTWGNNNSLTVSGRQQWKFRIYEVVYQ